MRVQMTNLVTNVAAGALDEVMEGVDATAGRTEPFKTYTDWSRLGLAVVGYLGNSFGYFRQFAEPLAQSETTLLTKSVGKLIRSRMGATASVARMASVSSPSPSAGGVSRRVGWRPQPVGV